jgi:hypothetical protein
LAHLFFSVVSPPTTRNTMGITGKTYPTSTPTPTHNPSKAYTWDLPTVILNNSHDNRTRLPPFINQPVTNIRTIT